MERQMKGFCRILYKTKQPGVFNSRTRIVEENLHVKFSKETPNIAGNRPNWIFDIDTLTISMNYKPVIAGNQTNGNAGTKENIDAGQAGKKIVPDQEYILLPLLTSESINYSKKSAHMVAASKEVIENRNTVPKTKVVEGVEKVIPLTTTEEKAQKRLEVKARSTLIMGIPNEHQLKLNSIKDAKLLLEAIKKREAVESLSPEWNTHAVVWRNKPELETMSMDDLYNNLKVYEPEVKGTSSSSTSTQNMAFVSSNNSGSTNEAVNTAHGVSTASTQANAANPINVDNLSDVVICSFFASQPSSPQLENEYLQQLHLDDLEEMDLR
ncbi:hypothetical protein Tco_0714211 [Tanacetum coccineum]